MMGVIPLDKFNLNNFYEKTPTALKYIIVISLIVVGSYFVFSRKMSRGQAKQLDNIEQTIETAYNLIDQFDAFALTQYHYNEDILIYLRNIYTLVEELNENTNKKFDLLLSQGGSNTNDILERITMLNESFDKLTDAYTPNEFEKSDIPDPRQRGEVEFIPVDKYGNPIGPPIRGDSLIIGVRKQYDDDQYEY